MTSLQKVNVGARIPLVLNLLINELVESDAKAGGKLTFTQAIEEGLVLFLRKHDKERFEIWRAAKTGDVAVGMVKQRR